MRALRGMTWNHDRGRGPLVATSRAFSAGQDRAEVHWDVRSLEDFAHYSIEELSLTYDLIAVDHPFVGLAAKTGCLRPLDDFLSESDLRLRAEDSVGGSFQSYRYGGSQWAIPIDAACHVSAFRPDLLSGIDIGSLDSWDSASTLIGSRGTDLGVALPLVPTDVYCLFLSVLAGLGHPPFESPESLVDREAAIASLEVMAALARHAHPASWTSNPIDLLEIMAASDEIAYVPALFGYSNYSRGGYRQNRIRFGPVPGTTGGVLGGVGLAVSRSCSLPELASAYVRFVSDPTVQATLYVEAGGQPASRHAWDNTQADMVAGQFLSSTRTGLDAAWVRPRFNGITSLAPRIGSILRRVLTGEASAGPALDLLDAEYRRILAGYSPREADEPKSGWYGSGTS